MAAADASGHGLPAALLARDTITGLRLLAEAGSRPAEVVSRVNRVVHRSARASGFVSLFYGELRANGVLVYCNAGHLPPLHRRGRTLRRLTRGGLLLGPNPAERYFGGRTRLLPGDTLFFFTDGITEQRDSAGEEFGEARLRRLLRQMPEQSAAGSVQAILAAVDSFAAGTPVTDDQTVVVVHRE